MAINAAAFVDLILARAIEVSETKEANVLSFINAAIASARSNPIQSIDLNVDKLKFTKIESDLDSEDLTRFMNTLLSDYGKEARSEILAFKTDFDRFVSDYMPFDDLMDPFARTTLDLLSGRTGIPAHVEDQIWQRDRSRVLEEVSRARDDVLATFAARGFPLPPGVAAHTVRLANVEAQNKIAQLSRDVAIKHIDMLIDGMKTAMTSLVQMRTSAIGLIGEYVRGRVGVGGNVVPLLTGRIDANVKLMAMANDYYRTRLDAEKAFADTQLRVGEIEKDIALAQSGFAMDRYKALTETISRAASALADQAAAALNAVHASAGVSASGETD